MKRLLLQKYLTFVSTVLGNSHLAHPSPQRRQIYFCQKKKKEIRSQIRTFVLRLGVRNQQTLIPFPSAEPGTRRDWRDFCTGSCPFFEK